MPGLVDTAVQHMEPSLRRDQRLLYEAPEEPVRVAADATRVATAVSNLLDNALKYSPDAGDVFCRVSVRDDFAAVQVIDHGLGIAAEDMTRLFTRFGRIVTAENSHILGTGLGLYLARELIRMQGGEISVESSPGEGSTFTLTLPLLAG